MITPEKHLNLDACVLRSGAILLSVLRKSRIITLSDLRERLSDAIGDDAEFMFLPAVNFLFLVGRLDYHPRSDSFEFVKKEKA